VAVSIDLEKSSGYPDRGVPALRRGGFLEVSRTMESWMLELWEVL